MIYHLIGYFDLHTVNTGHSIFTAIHQLAANWLEDPWWLSTIRRSKGTWISLALVYSITINVSVALWIKSKQQESESCENAFWEITAELKFILTNPILSWQGQIGKTKILPSHYSVPEDLVSCLQQYMPWVYQILPQRAMGLFAIIIIISGYSTVYPCHCCGNRYKHWILPARHRGELKVTLWNMI